MRDIFLDGLPIVDRLEITGSTLEVARWANCDQSSVSRIYRYVSGQLGLEFRKEDGFYRAEQNLDLLTSLRRASQTLRLGQGIRQLQWVGHPWNSQALGQLGTAEPIRRSWFSEQRTMALLQSRALDLAVMRGLDVLPPGWSDGRQPFEAGPWMAFGLVRYPVELAAHPQHPLQGQAPLTAEQLARYPSPAGPAEEFPVLSTCLRRLGLWRHSQPLPVYEPRLWEGSTADCCHLVPSSPLSRQALHGRVRLQPLRFDTGIEDIDMVMVRREHHDHPTVQELIGQIRGAYRRAFGNLEGLTWL
jgi:hypothetical protein